jgi:hypothetical protein
MGDMIVAAVAAVPMLVASAKVGAIGRADEVRGLRFGYSITRPVLGLGGRGG